MSCDFGVLNLESKISNQEAASLFEQLCDGDISGVAKTDSINKFYIELTNKYPEIDDVPESDIDNCPWSIAFDKSDGHIIISCVWEKADAIYEVIADLAAKHQLALFSPQAEIITYPDGSDGSSPWWKFW